MPKTSTPSRSEDSVVKSGAGLGRPKKLPPQKLMDIWVEGQRCKKIPLTKGLFAIVDLKDAKKINRFYWNAVKSASAPTFYATRAEHDPPGTRRTIIMHRVILGILNAGRKVEVDHINGDGLDNRRCNLRIANRAQNSQNTRKHMQATSHFRGVSWHRDAGKWRAHIKLDYRQHHLGLFTSELEAAKAYDAAAHKLFKEFARPNFNHQRL